MNRDRVTTRTMDARYEQEENEGGVKRMFRITADRVCTAILCVTGVVVSIGCVIVKVVSVVSNADNKEEEEE